MSRLSKIQKARNMTQKEAAARLGMSISTIKRYWSMSREQYEAQSITRAQPWAALGMSRATWYRRGKPDPQQQQTDQRESASA